MSYTLEVILFAVILLPGILMSILPVPGMLYMFAVAVIFGFVDHFVHLSGFDVGMLAIVAGAALLIDFVAGIAGAKWGGAHWTSIGWGIVGLVVGSFLIPIPLVGGIIGMFLGVLASEWYRTKDMRLANKAATGSFIGWIAGAGFKLLASIIFLVLFLVFAF